VDTPILLALPELDNWGEAEIEDGRKNAIRWIDVGSSPGR
jgi:hypothetical protein